MGSEACSWAHELAARLSMTQASFADDPPEVRRDYLVEEIQRALRDVVESRRSEYLAALRDRFPGPERIEVPAPESDALPPPAPVDYSPTELTDKLIAKLPEITPDAKGILALRLQKAGLLGAAESAIQLSEELRGKLGMTPQEPLDEERFSKLFAVLLEMAASLDQLIWSLWKNLAPKSGVRREAGENLRRTVGRYLAGDREVATLQIAQMLERTRQLIAGLLSGIGPAGENYARHHLETFAPEKIRASVETGGFLSSIEQKCWRRYEELAGQLNGPTVEREIIDAIVNYAEEVVSDARRR
jgi:hypothetical protein